MNNKYILILILLPVLIFGTGYWYYPASTQYPQNTTTAMTFGKICGTPHDTGRVYILYYQSVPGRALFQSYDPFYNQWNYNLADLPVFPQKGSALCPWYHPVENAKIFAIPYDYSGSVGHLYEYDIVNNTWRSLDTVPHRSNILGYGLSLKTGDRCMIDGLPFQNFYYFGGQRTEFYVYRREIGPAAVQTLTRGWTRLTDYANGLYSHGDGADLAYRPLSGVDNPKRIYGLCGGNSKFFWYYNIETNAWILAHDAPSNVAGGGSLASIGVLGADTIPSDRLLYAFKGDGSNNFYSYDYFTNGFSSAPADPRQGAYQGADLSFGYYKVAGTVKRGIWATFGNNVGDVGFFDPSGTEAGGSQSAGITPIEEKNRITCDARNQLFIRLSSILNTDAKLKLYDASGRIAQVFSIPQGVKDYHLKWDNVRNGVYYYRLITADNETHGKLVKY